MNRIFGFLSRGFNLVSSLVVGGAFLLMGGGILFYVVPQQYSGINRINNMPVLNAAGLRSAAVGTELMLTGTPRDNPAINSEGMIAYETQRWVVEYDDEDGYEGTWETFESHIPALMVQAEDSFIITASSDEDILSGALENIITHRTNSELSADGIPEGSIRVSGLMNGATITLIGIKTQDGKLEPTRIFAGTPDQLVNNLHLGTLLFLLCGGIFFLLGPFVIISGLRGKGRASISIG